MSGGKWIGQQGGYGFTMEVPTTEGPPRTGMKFDANGRCIDEGHPLPTETLILRAQLAEANRRIHALEEMLEDERVIAREMGERDE